MDTLFLLTLPDFHNSNLLVFWNVSRAYTAFMLLTFCSPTNAIKRFQNVSALMCLNGGNREHTHHVAQANSVQNAQNRRKYDKICDFFKSKMTKISICRKPISILSKYVYYLVRGKMSSINIMHANTRSQMKCTFRIISLRWR